jgi:hypothetical protein
MLFVLCVFITVTAVLEHTATVELAWRALSPSLFSLVAAGAVSFGIGIAVIRRKIARDPGYYKKLIKK